jgi:hypothetical protein
MVSIENASLLHHHKNGKIVLELLLVGDHLYITAHLAGREGSTHGSPLMETPEAHTLVSPDSTHVDPVGYTSAVIYLSWE